MNMKNNAEVQDKSAPGSFSETDNNTDCGNNNNGSLNSASNAENNKKNPENITKYKIDKTCLIDESDAVLEYVNAIIECPFTSKAEIFMAFKDYVKPSKIHKIFEIATVVRQIPLEAPFTMRATKVQKKIVEKAEEQFSNSRDLLGENDFVQSSSEGEPSDERLFLGDILIQNEDLWIKNRKILENASFTIVRDRIYGLVGRNGIGKSTVLKGIRKRKFGVSKGLKMCLVKQENKVDDISIIDYVVGGSNDPSVLENSCRILKELGFETKPQNNDVLNNSKNELTRVNLNSTGSSNKSNASGSINGIPIHENMRNLSGGWAVRANLAKAIQTRPELLLLDEPTNMLDIPTIIWLEKTIKNMNTTCIIVSHDREFLNSVCTDILHLENLKVNAYKGNYDSFVQIRSVKLDNQQKEYEKQRADREHLQAFVDRFRSNAKRASLAQSKIKILQNMKLIEKVVRDPIIKFKFRDSEIRGIILELKNVTFAYESSRENSEILGNHNAENTSEIVKEIKDTNLEQKKALDIEENHSKANLEAEKILFPQNTNNSMAKEKNHKRYKIILKDIDLKITSESRIVIVGPNGTGKSTLLKLLSDKITPQKGDVIKNPNLRPAYFTQHHIDQLKLNESVIDFITKNTKRREDECRAEMSKFGLLADRQKIGTLSGGQKSRLAFACLSLIEPNILLLDEPTNHLDIESIDALAECLKSFKGAVICVSHDMKFIESVFDEVWVCNNLHLDKFKGTIRDYRDMLIKSVTV
ncbi:hypothetical protein EDEG_01370 [Edhazardia aedis USNM 41457]|uniref:ABC transporter domain-containing protein n=1 Tax=Edhazardia aedis (strain USNM 41457) TaxID=1003232 RepID=J9DPB8_EDHAE|nr:hypothetical protein EDEG_01370 [Edhazardia aedis USNM 41457]|eukprot:EJW04390.1 hypothetical protein EDEG_01370 [Edhazardia aedis USNM 41457]